MQISIPTNPGLSWEDVENGDIEMPILETTETTSSSDPPPPSSTTFRPLEVSDRNQIQELHEEWFPVSYKDEFYDDLVLERMVHSGEELYTCAAVCNKETEEAYDDENENDCDGTITTPEGNNHERKSLWEQINGASGDHIAACIVGSFVDVVHLSMETRELLVADPTLHKRMFYIMTLGTRKEFRHYGLATTLLKRVMKQVESDAQCGTLYLHVITFNVAAIRFYEKLGFYRVTEMKDYYKIDDQSFNCYVYAKYYHGNQGQKDYYYLLTSLVSSIWKKVTSPFLLSTENCESKDR
mmetsp:Transcript_27124/g.45220  ORF Transcript_27124/g.45220 Transcript_27124/m.45220 type:complete len:297 (-) Transcript_27124:749-1639(-)